MPADSPSPSTAASLAAVRDPAPLDTPADVAFDRWTRLAAKLLHAPISLLTLVDGEKQLVGSCVGAALRLAPPDSGFSHQVITGGTSLRIDDVRLLAKPDPLATALEGVACLGTPVHDPQGEAVGALCVIDRQPRKWTDQDEETLVQLAVGIGTEIALRSARRLGDERQRLLDDAQQVLAEESMLLEGILEAMEERVVVVGSDGATLLTNRAARDAFRAGGAKVRENVDLPGWSSGARIFEADGRTPCPPEQLPSVRALQGETVPKRDLLVRPANGHGGSWQRISAHPLPAIGASASAALVVSRDVSAERANADLLAERARETAFLLEVAKTANSEGTLTEGLREGLRLLCVEYGWPLGHVFLRDGDEMTSSEIWFGEEAERYRRFVAETRALRFRPGQGMVGEAMQSGKLEALRIPEEGECPRFLRLEAARAAGLAFGVWLPLTIGARSAAVIEVLGGEDAPFRSKYIEVLQSVGTLLGRVVERDEARAELEALARVDELTGLHNRRGFTTLADQQLRIGRRFKHPLHLFFIDLDGLKDINDRHGHAAGDAALKEMAGVLRSTFREADLLCRLGGDEFVVLAEGDPAVPLKRFADALAALRALPDRPFTLAASVGVSKFDDSSADGITEMLAMADARMYSEKRRRKETAAV